MKKNEEKKSVAGEIVKDTAKDQTKSILSSIIDFFITSPLKIFIFGLLGIGSVAGVAYNSSKSGNFFSRNKLKLTDTAVIIEESKKIAKLFSMSYYSEIVIDTNKIIYESSSNYISNFFTDEEEKEEYNYDDSTLYRLTIIANGTSYAGNDLSKINKSDIKITDSSCTIKIKSAEIISTVVNPSDFTIFIDEGEWSPEEVQQIKTIAVEKVKQLSIKSKILEKANIRTEKLLTEFLKSVGFQVVIINFK